VPGVPKAVFWENEMTFDAIMGALSGDTPAARPRGVATPRRAQYTSPWFEVRHLSKVA